MVRTEPDRLVTGNRPVLALIAILRFPLTEARMLQIRDELEATRGRYDDSKHISCKHQ